MGNMKRGFSTIMGALIFVCIIFTCIVPLWVTMQQADLMYDKTVVDMNQFDIDRANEDLLLSTINDTIHLKNMGSISVNVIRVWFNHTYEEEKLILPIFTQNKLSFPELNGTYNVMVITERGRIFTTELSNYIPPEPDPDTTDTNMTVSPVSGVKNDLITIRGYGFGSEVNVTTIKFGGSSLATSPSVPVTDGMGSWGAIFNVPDKMGGDYIIVAMDEVGVTASVVFRIDPDPEPDPFKFYVSDTWNDLTYHRFHTVEISTSYKNLRIQNDLPTTDHKRAFEGTGTPPGYYGWYWAQNKVCGNKIKINASLGLYHMNLWGVTYASVCIIIADTTRFDDLTPPDVPYLILVWNEDAQGWGNGTYNNHVAGTITLDATDILNFTVAEPNTVSHNRLNELEGKNINVLIGYSDSWSGACEQWASAHKDSWIDIGAGGLEGE